MRALLAIVALLLSLPALHSSDLDEMRARGSLRVIATDDSQPERFSHEQGSEPGLERELVESFARLEGLDLEIVVVTLPEALPTLLADEGDLAVGLIDTAERRLRVDFCQEVLPARHVVVNRSPSPPIGSLEELRASKVGVLKASSWARVVAAVDVPEAQTQSFERIDGLLGALREGRIAATVMSVVHFTIAAKKDPGLQRGMSIGADGSSAWALRKQDDALEAALNEHLANSRRSGAWSRLVVKYFGDAALSVLLR